jgi:triosephosphate isomerase
MKKIIIFNWKMAPQSFGAAKHLFSQLLKTKSSKLKADLVVCPPFIYVQEIAGLIYKTKIKLGAQDAFWESKGAYTGEISAKMLKNLGVEYVIIGHSERRKFLGETDKMINKKVLVSLKAGLNVILCVGENLKIRRGGGKAVENFIKSQLKKDLKGLSRVKSQKSKVIVAYEPVWAIGAGHNDTPKDTYDMIQYIKELLVKKYKLQNPKVIYGGSVNSKNIKDFVKYLPRSDAKHLLRGKEIDGVLVGGASLKSAEVGKIIKISSKIKN